MNEEVYYDFKDDEILIISYFFDLKENCFFQNINGLGKIGNRYISKNCIYLGEI